MEKKPFFSNPNIINWQMQSPEAAGPLRSLSSGHLNLIWDQTIDQTAKFDSALSSHVSSPSSNPPASGSGGGGGGCGVSGGGCGVSGDSVVIRELIGRLGSICNSDEISPTSSHYQSANNSNYSTPMNSPPKLNLSFVANPSHMPFSADPGFAERAARCSTFSRSGGRNHGGRQFMLPEAAGKLVNAHEEESASGNSKKRKAVTPKGKGKEASLSSSITTITNPPKEAGEGAMNAKKCKQSEEARDERDSAEQHANAGSIKLEDRTTKPPDLSKDFIHVRARRGQATDSHSLAERVRREKISERMKLLQDLVPGCNKVTGKAVMLDEIINYVQSLQRQVEFLSMKLATVNPQLDFNMDTFVTKNIELHQNSVLLQPQSVYPMENIPTSFSFANVHERTPLVAINGLELETQNSFGHSNFNRSLNMQLPSLEGFGDASYQVGTLWDDDLQNVVQMGFIHNQDHVFSSQSIQGSAPSNHMKIEL